MIEKKAPLPQTQTAGDAAVDGLLTGVLAGILMLFYLLLSGLLGGEAVAEILSRFDPRPEAAPLSGLLLHLAISGAYGILYGLLRSWLPRAWLGRVPDWIAGLGFAAGIFLLAQGVLLPIQNPRLEEIPKVHFAIAHGIFGLTLGQGLNRFLTEKNQAKTGRDALSSKA